MPPFASARAPAGEEPSRLGADQRRDEFSTIGEASKGLRRYVCIMKINRIGQIALRARDVDRAIAFYRDTLGLQYLFRAGNLAFFDCDGVRLMLDKPEDPQFDHPSSILYFFVDDIQKSFGELRDKRVEVVGEPHRIARLQDREVWLAHFRDSEENMHALMSEVQFER